MKVIENKLHFVILIIGLLLSINAFAQTDNKYILDGEISGLKAPTKLYLCIYPGFDTVAQTIAHNGKFTFKGEVTNGANVYFIKMDTLVKEQPSRAIWLMNKSIKLKSSLAAWPALEITGSEAQQDYNTLLKLVSETKEKGDDVNMVYKDFIKIYTNSLYVAALISKCESILGREGLKEAYENLTARAKNSHFGLELKKQVEKLKFVAQIEAGGELPDFKASTPDGQEVSVLKFAKKGELTLIDFWASWCSPCRSEIPNMKKVYDAFHDQGFNIIGVSTDKSEANWKNALAEDNTPWFQVRDNLEKASKEIFGLNSIPAFALVAGDGKLIAFSSGMSAIKSFGPEIRGEELYKTVAHLLKENK